MDDGEYGRRRAERRSFKERRQPERRKRGWSGSVNFDYESEKKVSGRRQKGSEKRVVIPERRVADRRFKVQRQNVADRRGQPGQRTGRSTDQIYRRTVTSREVPQCEGVGSVVAHGKKTKEELVFRPGNVPRRSEDTAAAIAASPIRDNSTSVKAKHVPSAPVYQGRKDNLPASPKKTDTWTKIVDWLRETKTSFRKGWIDR